MTSTIPRAARKPGPRSYLPSPWVALALLASAQLMLVLDVTVVNVALPEIGVARPAAWPPRRRPSRNPAVWPNPAGFDPGRFLSGVLERHRYAWIPFGGGKRGCIGAGFAGTTDELALRAGLPALRSSWSL